jgi:CheY-like chemotaxis protein
LPPTATPDERILNSTAEPPAHGSGTVVICAQQAAGAAALAQVCRTAGYTPHVVNERWQWHVAGARAVLWDTTPERIANADAVRQIQTAANRAPVLAIVGFPRAEDVEAARDAGVAAVISKPYLIRDLLSELARVLEVCA